MTVWEVPTTTNPKGRVRLANTIAVSAVVSLLVAGLVTTYDISWPHPTTTTWDTTTTRPRPTTTLYTYTPLVESPFTDKELAFLNAWAVVGSYRTRYTANGVDTNGDGRINHGWHDLDWLEPTVNRVENGLMSCNHEAAERWLSRTASSEREGLEQFILVARGWLC